jgi:hypothetical protein
VDRESALERLDVVVVEGADVEPMYRSEKGGRGDTVSMSTKTDNLSLGN